MTEDFQLEPSPPDPQPVKVYRLDDYEWWAGYSLLSCIAAARDAAGQDCYEDAEDDGDELSEAEMQSMRMTSDRGDSINFATELQRRIDAGEQFPQLFACTEY